MRFIASASWRSVAAGDTWRAYVSIAPRCSAISLAGPVAILGYAFDGEWAQRHRAAIDRFLKAAFAAKEILAGSAQEWTKLAPRIGVTDETMLAIFRKRYTEGIPRRQVEDEERDARALFGVLAETGGAELVGKARELDSGTFWRLDQGG